MNIFDLLIKQPIYNLLVWLYDTIPGHDLGVAIIALTIIVRLILYPLAARSLRSQRALQKLQPQIAALRAEYKDRPKELNAAMMEFYKEREVSPFSSCLPTLVQAPILIALYFAFMDLIHGHNLTYSFIHYPAHIGHSFLGLIDLYHPDHTYLLPILAAALQFIQARMLMPAKSGSDDPAQAAGRTLVYVMPVLTFVFALSFPAALPLYWVVTTLFSIGQQRRIMGLEVEHLEHPTGAVAETPTPASRPSPAVETKEVNGVTVTRSTLKPVPETPVKPRPKGRAKSKRKKR